MNTPVRLRHPRRHREVQRGAAALVVTMVLFFAMLLIAAFANRGLVFEQRASANQYRATQAFEAAEAGLEWALAELNNPQPLGADCRPASAAGAQTLRERLLRYSAATGSHEPVTWNNAGSATALQAACVRAGSGAGWACSCPGTGFPAPNATAAAAGAAQPAFVVQLAAGGQPGVLRLTATGCTSLAGACQPGAATPGTADATSRVQVALALVPGLATLPLAPLTAKGDVLVGASAIGLHNPDAATGGVALHAGGNSDATAARVSTAPGASPLNALALNDERLRSRTGDGLFATFFGLDKATWQSQAAVSRVACNGNCVTTIANAPAALVWVDGDVTLEGPATVGTPERPVLIVASGAATLRGAVTLHGAVYASAIAWNDTPASGALLRGAAISESNYGGNGTPDLFYDSAVLERLRAQSGSFARVPGSWRDF